MGRIRHLRLYQSLTEETGLKAQELAVLLGSGEGKGGNDAEHKPQPTGPGTRRPTDST
jgi:hypothetical protein